MSFFGCSSPRVTHKWISINCSVYNVIWFICDDSYFGICSYGVILRNSTRIKVKSCIVHFLSWCKSIRQICTFCTSSLIWLWVSFQRILLISSQKFTTVVVFPSHILPSTTLSTHHSNPLNTFPIYPHCPHQI